MTDPFAGAPALRRGLRTLLAVLLMLAVPTVGCLCWYASDGVRAGRAAWAPLVGAAWPVLLVSGAGLAAALLARPRRTAIARACAVALAMSAALLLVARAHWFGF